MAKSGTKFTIEKYIGAAPILGKMCDEISSGLSLDLYAFLFVY